MKLGHVLLIISVAALLSALTFPAVVGEEAYRQIQRDAAYPGQGTDLPPAAEAVVILNHLHHHPRRPLVQ